MEIYDFLKSWKRMCNSMTEMNGCEDCPIVRNTHGARCGDMPCEMQDVESIVREVEKWAAEHPEPKYPTWVEWLMKCGVLMPTMDTDIVFSEDGKHLVTGVRFTLKAYEPMPADTAQKLGVEPKGEV